MLRERLTHRTSKIVCRKRSGIRRLNCIHRLGERKQRCQHAGVRLVGQHANNKHRFASWEARLKRAGELFGTFCIMCAVHYEQRVCAKHFKTPWPAHLEQPTLKCIVAYGKTSSTQGLASFYG